MSLAAAPAGKRAAPITPAAEPAAKDATKDPAPPNDASKDAPPPKDPAAVRRAIGGALGVAAAGQPTANEDFQTRVDAAIERAKEYLFSLQSEKVLLLVGEATQVLIDRPHPALERIEVEAKWADVTVNRGNRSVKINGKTYSNVYLVMPPGWFGPAEWTGGEPYDSVNAAGHTALITAALLAARCDPNRDPRMKAAVDCLLNMQMRELGYIPGKGQAPAAPPGAPIGKGAPVLVGVLSDGPMGSYAIGLRASALELALRSVHDPAKRAPLIKALQRDARMLAGGYGPGGGYGYVMQDPAGRGNNGFFGWSNSRTQYGILGLWAAASVPGVEVPVPTWEHFNRFFLENQCQDGGWTYSMPNRNLKSTPRMTAAGIASLYVIMDQLHTRTRGFKGPDTSPIAGTSLLGKTIAAIDRGLDHFVRTFRADADGYSMYGIERVGVASGYKHFGTHDWFREGAEVLLAGQSDAGALGGKATDLIGGTPARCTAWNLLFLVHGSAPVFVNKLQYGAKGDWAWNNYPRDAANLARWHDRTFEQEANWQIVTLAAGREDDLRDAPFLYVSGFKAFDFDLGEIGRLRQYVEGGGTLLFVTCGGPGAGKPFADCVAKLAARLWPAEVCPERRLVPVTFDHPLRDDPEAAGGKGALGKLEMLHVHNGHRSLLIHVNEDIAWQWHSAAPADKKSAFQFMANLKRYCLDKGPLPPKSRPDPLAGLPEAPDRGPLTLGVVRYISKGKVRSGGEDFFAAGDWSAMPEAWSSYRPWFRRAAGYDIRETRGLALSDADALGKCDLLHISGHYGFELSEPELAGLRSYLIAGGTVLFEQVGGRGMEGRHGFADSAAAAMRALFPDAKVEPLPSSHPAVAGGIPGPAAGFDCRSVGYSRAMSLKRAEGAPPLSAIVVNGRAVALLSPLDLSCGLAGQTFQDREGYGFKTTRELTANLLLYAKSGRATK